MAWKDLESRRIRKSLEKELGLGMMLRDKSSSWYIHGVYIYSRD